MGIKLIRSCDDNDAITPYCVETYAWEFSIVPGSDAVKTDNVIIPMAVNEVISVDSVSIIISDTDEHELSLSVTQDGERLYYFAETSANQPYPSQTVAPMRHNGYISSGVLDLSCSINGGVATPHVVVVFVDISRYRVTRSQLMAINGKSKSII